MQSKWCMRSLLLCPKCRRLLPLSLFLQISTFTSTPWTHPSSLPPFIFANSSSLIIFGLVSLRRQEASRSHTRFCNGLFFQTCIYRENKNIGDSVFCYRIQINLTSHLLFLLSVFLILFPPFCNSPCISFPFRDVSSLRLGLQIVSNTFENC
jgi:hypothetical protein